MIGPLAELEFLWPQEVLGAVAHAQNDYGIPTNLEEDAVDLAAFAVEELTKPLVPLRFGCLGTAFGIVFQGINRFEKWVALTVGVGL